MDKERFEIYWALEGTINTAHQRHQIRKKFSPGFRVYKDVHRSILEDLHEQVIKVTWTTHH